MRDERVATAATTRGDRREHRRDTTDAQHEECQESMHRQHRFSPYGWNAAAGGVIILLSRALPP
jgi:hypothetical protein